MSKDTNAIYSTTLVYMQYSGKEDYSGRDDMEVVIQDMVTDLRHLAEEYACDWEHLLAAADMHFQAETGEGDDIAQDARRLEEQENPLLRHFAHDLDPVTDEIIIAAEMDITIDDVRHADHIEMMHERELAPGTKGLRDMHARMHGGGFDDHDHVWELR